MAQTVELVEGPRSKQWAIIMKKYHEVLTYKAKKKSNAKSGKELLDLDVWYQNDLPSNIQSREEKYLTSPELVKLMKWKLSRGKFRPRLVQLAESNKPDDVIQITKKGFKLLDSGKLEAAVQEMSTMKGIGPATASAILAAGSPDKAAFMADESTLGVLGEGKLQYSLPEYMQYMKGIKKVVETLNKEVDLVFAFLKEKPFLGEGKQIASDPDYCWNAHKVEIVIWTHYLAQQYDIPLDEEDKEDTGMKRKSETTREEVKKKKK